MNAKNTHNLQNVIYLKNGKVKDALLKIINDINI